MDTRTAISRSLEKATIFFPVLEPWHTLSFSKIPGMIPGQL